MTTWLHTWGLYFQTTVILNNLAKAYAESGNYKLAEEMAKEAVRIAESTQNSHLSRFLANLGAILNLEGIPWSSDLVVGICDLQRCKNQEWN